jgi:hypothetical protein
MVQSWYQGGVSIFDFTDSARAFEIAYFDRGPLDAKRLISGGYWSSYWYNGYIYATEIARGLDVFRLKPSEHLSQDEIKAAMLVYVEELNPQHQQRVTWPALTVVARAYIDQLTRSKAIPSERAASLRAALANADDLRTGRERNAATILSGLDAHAAQLEGEAASASAQRDATTLRSLSASIKAVTTRLRR